MNLIKYFLTLSLVLTCDLNAVSQKFVNSRSKSGTLTKNVNPQLKSAQIKNNNRLVKRSALNISSTTGTLLKTKKIFPSTNPGKLKTIKSPIKGMSQKKIIYSKQISSSSTSALNKTIPPKSKHTFFSEFEALIRRSMKQKNVPGMAVAVFMDGKIAFMKGFGVRTLGKPEFIDTHTVFQIGSTSKALTSALVAILKRDKILSLDHPVEPLPNVKVWHLLNHTTGIPSPGFNSLIEKGMPVNDVYNKVRMAIPDSLPGEKFSYHNVIYSLIGGIIENCSGQSFEDTLQARLLKPLGMKETSSTWDEFISRNNRSSVHVFKHHKIPKKNKYKPNRIHPHSAVKVSYRKDYANFPAAGGCSSSIHDMAIFLGALLGSRSDVISIKDLEDFIQPIVHTPDQWYRSRHHRDRITKTHYGLGWRTMTFGGQHLVFHGGWIRGISSLISFIPEKKVGIVILQNAELGLPFSLSMHFYDWILGLPPKKWIK